jgi:hypothetical protein
MHVQLGAEFRWHHHLQCDAGKLLWPLWVRFWLHTVRPLLWYRGRWLVAESYAVPVLPDQPFRHLQSVWIWNVQPGHFAAQCDVSTVSSRHREHGHGCLCLRELCCRPVPAVAGQLSLHGMRCWHVLRQRRYYRYMHQLQCRPVSVSTRQKQLRHLPARAPDRSDGGGIRELWRHTVRALHGGNGVE